MEPGCSPLLKVRFLPGQKYDYNLWDGASNYLGMYILAVGIESQSLGCFLSNKLGIARTFDC